MSLFLCKFAATVMRAMDMKKRITELKTELAHAQVNIKSLERAEHAYRDFIASMDPADSTYMHMGMLMEKTWNRLVHALLHQNIIEKEIANLEKASMIDIEYVATTWRVWSNEAKRMPPNKLPFNYDEIMVNVTTLMQA